MRAYLLLLFLLLLLYSCKENVLNLYSDADIDPFETLKQKFEDDSIYQKLNINQSSLVDWLPQWEEAVARKTSDSVEYLFVPIRPILKRDRGARTVERGGKTYLLVKNGREFYKAFYFNEDEFNSIDIRGFTGKMLFTSLRTGLASLITYSNGIPFPSKSVKRNRATSTSKKMGWEQQCNYQVKNCTWVIAGYGCGPDIQIYHSRDCVWPSHCSGYGWNLTDSSEDYVCEHYWVDDPPESPGQGGGDGSTASEHLALAPIEPIDLEERLKCFEPITTDPNTDYKVTIHVHSAFQGHSTVEYWNGDPGHAYITMEKSSGSDKKSLTFGFYPKTETWVTPTKNAVASGIGEESANVDRNSDIRYTVDISSSDFSNLIFSAKDSAAKHYDLNDYNCTHYAVEVFNSAMANSNQLEVGNSSLTGFKTPASLYKSLSDLKMTGVEGVEVDPIKAPKSTNCD